MCGLKNDETVKIIFTLIITWGDNMRHKLRMNFDHSIPFALYESCFSNAKFNCANLIVLVATEDLTHSRKFRSSNLQNNFGLL